MDSCVRSVEGLQRSCRTECKEVSCLFFSWKHEYFRFEGTDCRVRVSAGPDFSGDAGASTGNFNGAIVRNRLFSDIKSVRRRMMEEQCYALLIDADNVSAKYIKPILTELSKYGVITYKRIYGDWTSTHNSSWKDELLTNSIMPVQQFSYTQGKNATDSAMIIDAMDILYTNDVDGFCIVSSDSDFTRLVTRIRESAKMVIGMGENKTPEPFRKACDKFTILENLLSEQEPGKPEAEVAHDTLSKEKIEDAIIKMVIENQDNNRATGLGEVGSRLVSLYPDFDVRSYGYNMLSKFLEEFSRIQLVKNGSLVSVALKEDWGMKEGIDRYVIYLVKKAGRNGIELSTLGNKVYEKYEDFKISDYGYSQFNQYVKSIERIELEQDGTIWKARYQR